MKIIKTVRSFPFREAHVCSLAALWTSAPNLDTLLHFLLLSWTGFPKGSVSAAQQGGFPWPTGEIHGSHGNALLCPYYLLHINTVHLISGFPSTSSEWWISIPYVPSSWTFLWSARNFEWFWFTKRHVIAEGFHLHQYTEEMIITRHAKNKYIWYAFMLGTY